VDEHGTGGADNQPSKGVLVRKRIFENPLVLLAQGVIFLAYAAAFFNRLDDRGQASSRYCAGGSDALGEQLPHSALVSMQEIGISLDAPPRHVTLL
jgi:hypothetical protein